MVSIRQLSLLLAWISLEFKVCYSYLQLFLEVPAQWLVLVRWSTFVTNACSFWETQSQHNKVTGICAI